MKKAGVLFFFLLGFFILHPLLRPLAFAQSASFTKQTIDQDNSGDGKAVADIDMDGKADGMIAGNSLVWYSGGENFAKYTVRANVVFQEFTTNMAAGDVDGDGDPDMVAPDGSGQGNVLWFENPKLSPPSGKTADPKNGANWVQHTVGTHGNFAHAVEVGDMNGDGKMDILTSGNGSGHVWLFQSKDSFQDVNIGDANGSRGGIQAHDINKDGKADLAFSGGWLQNNGNGTSYTTRSVSGFQGEEVGAGDLNGDGRPDLIGSANAHGRGTVTIYFAPADPTSSSWTSKVLDSSMCSHRPVIVDFNSDGKNDVLLGCELVETSVYLNQGSNNFQKTQLDSASGHNAAVGDLNGDSKPDIFAADWIGHPPVKVYLNTMTGGTPPTVTLPPGGGTTTWDKWQYIQVTGNHHQTFGLDAGDLDGDGKKDIVSGFHWYKNPGATMTGPWQQSAAFPNGVEAVLTYDLNGDGKTDVIGQKTENGQAIYALINNGGGFTAVLMGNLPQASHGTAQGYKLAKIRGGAKPEIVFNSGGGMYYFVIPANPSTPNWEKVQVTGNTSDEGLGVGDIDADGKIDLAGTTGDSMNVEWYKNPGGAGGNWQTIHVGDMQGVVYPDRTEIVDVDIDGKLDIVTTEENGGGSGAVAYWYKNPGGTGANWTRTLIVEQGSMNNLDIGDFNKDGKTDLVLAEHRGELRVQVWESKGGGQLVSHLVGQGKESHLGGRAFDMDGDGDLDIVSIAYDANQFIHLWRNDNTGGGGGGTCAKKTQGDANCDGKVSLVDYQAWRNEYKGISATKTADFDGNGSVTLADYQAWRTGFKSGQ